MKPVYRQRIIRAGNTIEVENTYPTKFGDTLTRKKKGKATPEAMQVYNEELAIRKLTRLINENFIPDDWFVTFHYENHNRPKDYEKASAQLGAFLRKLRKLYAEWGIEFKYIKRTAYGERGGIHHHVILPQGEKFKKVTELWKEHIKATRDARPPDCRAMYDTGEYSSLAAYIVKQPMYQENDGYIKKWIGSRNLKKPTEEPPRDIYEIKWKEPPVARPGYYIDTDSIRAGCNPVNGRPYLFYRMVKLPPDFHCYDENNKRLYGSEAIKYFRKHNKEWIRDNMWTGLCPDGEIIPNSECGMRNSEREEGG